MIDSTHAAYNHPVPEALHVTETGEGPPLVALHGFGASGYTWRHVLSVLEESHRVYAVDLKGSGLSPKPRDGRYSMRDQASLVLDLIAERQLTGLTLMGHSFGGGVALVTALELLRAHSGVLTSLVLFASPAYRQPLPAFIRVLRTPVLGPLAQKILPNALQVRLVLNRAYYDDALVADDAVAAYAKALNLPGGPEALRETARQIVPADIDALAAAYPAIDIPTLLVWGRDDRIVPLEIGERLHRAIPASTLLVIDQAGHVPHEETPERVRPALREFLATSLPSRAPSPQTTSRP
jgi:pimeloyl-ACP methyl ester carboxylesterase